MSSRFLSYFCIDHQSIPIEIQYTLCVYCSVNVHKNWLHLHHVTVFKGCVVGEENTYRDDISDGYSIPDEIPTTLAFGSVNWCKIDVFTSNIMVLYHKMSRTIKINVNRYTNIYLLMNLFKINQFIFIFSCISALFSFIPQIILYFCCCW